MSNEINTSEGYIKIYRKFLNWEWYDDANTMRLFLHCLLSANHADNKWRGIVVKQGSFITSIGKLAHSLNLTVQQIRTSLNKLKSTNEITSETTNSYTVIVLNNWNLYQGNNKQDNKPATNEQQTNNKRITTNNNEKNDKNEKNENISLDKKTKKLDPYCNSIETYFKQEYRKEFNYKVFLSNSNKNKLVELNAEIENFKEYIPIVIRKLKRIKWDINFVPTASWLLKEDNFISVLNGAYDTNGNINRQNANSTAINATSKIIKQYKKEEKLAADPNTNLEWKKLGENLRRITNE